MTDAYMACVCSITTVMLHHKHCIPYMWKFSRYEIFAEQEANRIFAIIFSRITDSSWKGSMLRTVTNL